MAVVIDEMLVDASGADESKKRGGGDSQSDAGGEPPKPEEIEHALRQQVERMERIRAH